MHGGHHFLGADQQDQNVADFLGLLEALEVLGDRIEGVLDLVFGLGQACRGGLGLGVVSTYLGALAGSSVLVGSLFGAYGAKMTGRLMDQYAKEVQDFEFLPVQGM